MNTDNQPLPLASFFLAHVEKFVLAIFVSLSLLLFLLAGPRATSHQASPADQDRPEASQPPARVISAQVEQISDEDRGPVAPSSQTPSSQASFDSDHQSGAPSADPTDPVNWKPPRQFSQEQPQEDPIPRTPQVVRREPRILPLVQPTGSSGYAALAFQPYGVTGLGGQALLRASQQRLDAGLQLWQEVQTAGSAGRLPNHRQQGRYWVCLLAKQQTWLQEQEYRQAIPQASWGILPTDQPILRGVQVQRAQLPSRSSRQNTEEAGWTNLAPLNLQRELLSWQGFAPELIPRNLLARGICCPLPVRLDARWSRGEVLHPSFRDQASISGATSRKEQRTLAKQLAALDAAGARGWVDPDPAWGPIFFLPLDRPRAHGTDQPPKDQMFRYFDFYVEAGRTYLYRARLVYDNPNARLSLSQTDASQRSWSVAPGVDDSSSVLHSPWTQFPRQTISPPQRLFVGPTRKGSVTTAATLEIVLGRFVVSLGKELYVSLEQVHRGALLEVLDRGLLVIPPGQDQPRRIHTSFQPEVLLVDFLGGRALHAHRSSPPEPTEAVFVNSAGELTVGSFLQDQQRYEDAKRKIAQLSF